MSTPNIDDVAKKFSDELNTALADFRAEAAKKESKKVDEIPVLTTRVSKSAVTKVRAPKDQAEQIVKGVSWTCSSAHMSDNARHIDLFKGKDYIVDPKTGLTDDEYKAFTGAWTAAMKKNGVLNYKGEAGYNNGDAYHIELPDSKLPFTDKRVQECVAQYAKLTRDDGKKKNTAFEKDAQIKKYLDDYEKKQKK